MWKTWDFVLNRNQWEDLVRFVLWASDWLQGKAWTVGTVAECRDWRGGLAVVPRQVVVAGAGSSKDRACEGLEGYLGDRGDETYSKSYHILFFFFFSDGCILPKNITC